MTNTYPPPSEAHTMLTFSEFARALEARRMSYRNIHGVLEDCEDWTEADWVTAFIGEVGEACNFLKKVRRGDFPMDVARPHIAKELGDAAAYLFHLARKCGVDLGEASFDKFNEISDRIGNDVHLGCRGRMERWVQKPDTTHIATSSTPHVPYVFRMWPPGGPQPGDLDGPMPQPFQDANWNGTPLRARPDLKHDWSVEHEPTVSPEGRKGVSIARTAADQDRR